MSTVAIQPAVHHHPPPVSVPVSVPVAQARPRPKQQPSISGKENVQPGKTSNASQPGSGNNARARRERPCDACRRRKSRCVIHEGAVLCVLCDFHKQECTFVQDPQPRKRKVPTGDAKDDAPKKRSNDYSPALVSHTPTLTPTITRTSPSVLPSPIQLATAVKDTTVLGETLGLQRRQHSRYIGLTTPFDPLLIGLTQFDSRNESTFDLGTLRKVNDHECFIMLPDETTPQYGSEADVLAQVEQIVAPHGSALLDLYFRIVHPNFPIIQKQLLLDRHRTGDRSFAPSLIAGIYILALNWWSHDPRLANHPKPDAGQLEAIASKSLAAAMERPKLSTVQAGLLLLQRPGADSWSLTTQLVAIGQELGLHLDCSNWSIPLWERGLRKRIAWALYMQDKWSSLIHGRPSHIFSANWAVKPISDADFVEQDSSSSSSTGGSRVPSPPTTSDEQHEIDKGRSIFAEMISLTGIMAEVMDTFYTQVAIADFAAAGKNSTRLILDRAKPVQIRLKDWFGKLPPHIRMESSSTSNTTPSSPSSSSSPSATRNPHALSSTGFLHLAYFATEITLHRRIIQSLTSTPSPPDAYLLYICRQAAKTRLISAMDFVNRLTPRHLQSYWYFASAINFTLIGTFGSLLWATAPAAEEADFYRFRLKEYRWTLTVSMKNAGFLGHAVRMLDASREMLRGVAEKPRALLERSSVVGVPSASTAGGDAASEEDAEDADVDMIDGPPTVSVSVPPPGAPGTAAAPDGMGELRRYTTHGGSFAGFQNEEMYGRSGDEDDDDLDDEEDDDDE